MKTIAKRVLIWAFVRGWISMMTTQRIYDRLRLGGH